MKLPGISYAVIAAMGVALVASQASAEELWNPHLRGVDEGMAAGALPPQGVYFVDDSYFLSFESHDGSGKTTGTKLSGLVEVPILLWNPGIKVLGADYAVAVAQPFDYTSLSGTGTTTGNGHWGTFNTIVVPGILSWTLPHDFHASASFKVYVDDASSSSSNLPSNGGAGAGNAFWTLEPGVGLSWLHDGWNIGAQVLYDYSTADSKHVLTGGATEKYQSGDQIAIDYTATKTFGKWVAGIGAYQENQLQRDQVNGVSQAGTVRTTSGVGPIVGYNFGPVDVSATYNHEITTHHDFGGDIFNVRAVVPF